MKRKILLAVFFISTVSIQKLFAEEMVEMSEVVVSATKTNLPKKYVMQSVRVITSEEIESSQATDVHELLRDVAGLTVKQTGSRGASLSVFSRGSSTNHNLVLIDGVRVNQAGGNFDFSSFPTQNIERIEVLKFPQSALYGSDGVGSVIHIITKKGSGKVTTNASFQAGSLNTYEEKVAVSGGSSPDDGFALGLTRVDTDGTLQINNHFRELGISGSYHRKLYDRIKMQFSSHYVDSEFNFPTGSAGDISMKVNEFDPRSKNKTKRLTLATHLDMPITNWWKHSLILGLNQEDKLFSDILDPGIDTFGSQTSNLEARQSLEYMWNLSAPEFKGLNSQLIAGTVVEKELFEQTFTGVDTVGTSVFGGIQERQRRNAAFYIQDQLDWNHLVFFTPSVRFDDNQNYGGATSPRFTGGFLLPWTQTKLRGAWGQGIKAPTFFENFGSAGVTGNLNLRPEKVEGWESGFDQYFLGDAIELNWSYFKNKYSQLIAYSFSSTPNYNNVQSAESYGTETTLQLKHIFAKNYQSRLVLTHGYIESTALVDGGIGGTTFIPNQPLVRRPKHTGSVTASVTHPWFSFSAGVNFQGRVTDLDFSQSFSGVRKELPDYVKVDISGSVVVWKKGPEVRLLGKVENLLDRESQEISGFTSPRLRALAGLGVQF